MLFPHEMTHAVHQIVAKVSSGYERVFGRVVFEEGLAMHAVQWIYAGLANYRYVGDRSWFETSIADRRLIVAGLLPDLDKRDGETLFKFTWALDRPDESAKRTSLVGSSLGNCLKHQPFEQLTPLPEANLSQTEREITTAS